MVKVKKPKIAVLLAAYNGIDWVEEQVESILSQRDVIPILFISVDLSVDGTDDWVRNKINDTRSIIMLPYGESFGSAAGNFFRLIRDVDFSGFDAIIKAGYEYKYFAEKRIEDYIEHEIVHILTGQDIESVEDFNAFFEEVKDLYVPGVSGYSDEVQNGFETLAEAYVKIKNGEDVPEKAKEYVDRYIERWKR